ncbi:MAG TPA: phenylalanine--tRNA ligase subunit beta [Candidatus Hydrogenedens sp.]|nr:phenylalanine--tRNA ligase subunit beta [Candidatus Hydrogenedens sp.]
MKVSLKWLKEYCDFPVSPKELAEQMTMLGLEIESIEEPGKEIENVFVGKILDIQPHPQADKLVVCKTDIGKGEPLQIICGAKNMKVGDKVPTAIDGAVLPGGFKITRRKMRGVESFGMMCSGAELKIEEDSEGLLILDSTAPIGEDIKKVLGLDDVIFEIEVTPNRGDWASYLGLARELSAYYKIHVNRPKLNIRETDIDVKTVSSVTIECPDICPRYAGRVIRNVKIAPSPDWLVRKLTSAGQRPINNVVDITNFVLLETGHPLHAFDLNKLSERRIVVRLAKDNESIRTLDGELRQLNSSQMVIADAHNPQALAGIMGGADSEVDDNTVDVFLESAYFDPVSIRKTARAHNLLTEAAQHFQRGADPEMVIWAIDRASELIQDLAGGEILKGILDEYPKKIVNKSVGLRYIKTQKRLGVDIDKEYQKTTLIDLGFEKISETNEKIELKVPTWRHDVSREEDLIEEIARFYGYDIIPSTLPKIRQSDAVFDITFKKIHEIRTLLVHKGLTECFSWTFSNPELMIQLKFPDYYLNMIELQNPLSKNLSTIRTSIIPNLLLTAQKNHLEESLSVFEIGPVFLPHENELLPKEPQMLSILLSGMAQPRLWCFQNRKLYDFYDLKGIFDDIFNELCLTYRIERTDFPIFHPGQALKYIIQNEDVGHLGKINPKIAHELEINENTYIAEFCLDKLFMVPSKRKIYKPVSEFPSTSRDLAILVDRSLSSSEIINTVKSVGEGILRKVEIFDVYMGEQVPQGKKSIALGFTFCSDERTLTDNEIDQLMQTIIQQLESKLNAQIR